ncbi:MAG: exopolyphosphatase [Flavobacteriales bacterium]|nr:exopolyphosphatase [Flavobacteriales bacterium]
MILAAIDIGSNAVRLLIEEVVITGANEQYFRKISLTRVPLRLGEDVFSQGKITQEKSKKLIKTLKAFRYLMEVNDVKHFRACATSAMREAENGKDIRKLIKSKANIDLEIIRGYDEAELILANFNTANLQKDQTYLYIDVGGGSTEVSLLKNNKKIKSKSFKLGTVRLLKGKVNANIWEEAQQWVEELAINDQVIAIGTGGNINRIYKESVHSFGEKIKYDEIKSIVDHIGSFSFEERIKKLKLKPDRADVIIPAGKIYLSFMRHVNATEMLVPKVGLADGIIYNLFQKHIKNKT